MLRKDLLSPRGSTLMVTANEWAKSDDAVVVQIHINERGRGDGYDISIYQSKSTKRFLVEARHVATKLGIFLKIDRLSF